MIGSIDIQLNASHPNLALQTVYQFRNSPSQIRVLNVPKKIGQSDISSVYVAVNYPDGHNKSFQTTKVANAYVTEIDASDTSGKTANGFTILGNGTDRSGLPISNYVLGKGDFYVLQDDMQITIGEDSYFLRLVDSMPETPKKGDTLIVDGKLKIYNGTEWVAFGGECYWNVTDGKMSPNAEVSSVFISAYTVIDDLSSSSIPKKTSQLQNDSGFLSADQYWTTSNRILMMKDGVADYIKLNTASDGKVEIDSSVYIDGCAVQIHGEGVFVCASETITLESECGAIVEIDSSINIEDCCDFNVCTQALNFCAESGMNFDSEGSINFDTACSMYLNDSEVATVDDIPTKTSELQNDSGFLTQHQSLTAYAKKTEVPTKTSQLSNDSGFLSSDQYWTDNGYRISLKDDYSERHLAVNDIYSTDMNEDLTIGAGMACVNLEANKINLNGNFGVYVNEEEVATKKDISMTEWNDTATYDNFIFYTENGSFTDIYVCSTSIPACVFVQLPMVEYEDGSGEGAPSFSYVNDVIVKFDYSEIPDDASLPQISWSIADDATMQLIPITWESIEGDEVHAGGKYLHMIQLYTNDLGQTANGIMTIRKLNDACID